MKLMINVPTDNNIKRLKADLIIKNIQLLNTDTKHKKEILERIIKTIEHT